MHHKIYHGFTVYICAIYDPRPRSLKFATKSGSGVINCKPSDLGFELYICRIDLETMVYIIHNMISPPVTSVSASIEVESGRDGRFRVQCISSGGRPGDMYVTGPGGPYSNLNIQAVGTAQRRGSDSFSVTTSIISGGSNGDTYQCMAVNGVSILPATNSVQLRGNFAILNFPMHADCM